LMAAATFITVHDSAAGTVRLEGTALVASSH